MSKTIIWRHLVAPGGIRKHLGSIWRLLGGIWEASGGIWRTMVHGPWSVDHSSSSSTSSSSSSSLQASSFSSYLHTKTPLLKTKDPRPPHETRFSEHDSSEVRRSCCRNQGSREILEIRVESEEIPSFDGFEGVGGADESKGFCVFWPQHITGRSVTRISTSHIIDHSFCPQVYFSTNFSHKFFPQLQMPPRNTEKLFKNGDSNGPQTKCLARMKHRSPNSYSNNLCLCRTPGSRYLCPRWRHSKKMISRFMDLG